MDDSSFLPTNREFYQGGIWQRKDQESEPDPNDPAARGDVEGVEKQMEEATETEPAVKDRTLERSESADSLEKLEPKRRFKTTMRSPAKEQPVRPPSEQIQKGRVSRSQSFTSVASAPAVVGADFVNIAGTSPSRDESRRVAEAAARAIVNHTGLPAGRYGYGTITTILRSEGWTMTRQTCQLGMDWFNWVFA